MASSSPAAGEASQLDAAGRKSGGAPSSSAPSSQAQTPAVSSTAQQQLSEPPVEMSTLPSPQQPLLSSSTANSEQPQQMPSDSIAPAESPAAQKSTDAPSSASASKKATIDTSSPTSPSHPQLPTVPLLNRSESEAIGPSSENPAPKHDPAHGPAVLITLLLTSGSRHPYKVDEKYLRKRGITVEDMDPFFISVYTLKELIWRDWREDWESRPSSPSSIRLIHFGRMLDDKSPLKDCRFQTDSPNVVHMTVKPQEIVDEEDAKTGKGSGNREREGGERSIGCRCVIL